MNATVLKNREGFAAYPSVKLTVEKVNSDGETKLGWIRELIFGDHIRLLTENKTPVEKTFDGVKYVLVRARGKDGYVKPEEILPDRILEVNFVDVGQGDGCHIVTPDDEHFLVDAGVGDNMYRFLKWRFNLKRADKAPPPFQVIISHSDADHYMGFRSIFTPSNETNQQFAVDKVYHNGMVELKGGGTDSLGTIVEDLEGKKYIGDLCDSPAAYKKRAKDPEKGDYIQTLDLTTAEKESLRVGKGGRFYKKGKLTIDVLGPVAKKIAQKDALPVFKSNKGKTKNGHSVMLMLQMGDFRVFLGGDLNSEAEDYLLTHYSGVDVQTLKKKLAKKTTSASEKKNLQQELQNAILTARKFFQCDVAKSCHHGSADFTSEFLQALNPLATVISSGDNEPHCHPRPDTLGTIGKFSRGERPMIYSTELSRSGREFIDVDKIPDGATKERVVTVYGMINVRTDGKRAIIAQKLERRSPHGEWDIQEIAWDDAIKEFVYKG